MRQLLTSIAARSQLNCEAIVKHRSQDLKLCRSDLTIVNDLFPRVSSCERDAVQAPIFAKTSFSSGASSLHNIRAQIGKRLLVGLSDCLRWHSFS